MGQAAKRLPALGPPQRSLKVPAPKLRKSRQAGSSSLPLSCTCFIVKIMRTSFSCSPVWHCHHNVGPHISKKQFYRFISYQNLGQAWQVRPARCLRRGWCVQGSQMGIICHMLASRHPYQSFPQAAARKREHSCPEINNPERYHPFLQMRIGPSIHTWLTEGLDDGLGC